MVHIGMCWAVDWETVEAWFSKKYEYRTEKVSQCDNGHKRKGKFCSECGAPISQVEVKVKNEDFEANDYICEWGFTLSEDLTNVYFPIRNLKGDYFGLSSDFIDKMKTTFDKEMENSSEDVKEFVLFLATEDEQELCIYDDGYYSRDWSTY